MTFALALTFGWLVACSALFLAWEEDWGYFSSFYFSFISLTTIGLGQPFDFFLKFQRYSIHYGLIF